MFLQIKNDFLLHLFFSNQTENYVCRQYNHWGWFCLFGYISTYIDKYSMVCILTYYTDIRMMYSTRSLKKYKSAQAYFFEIIQWNIYLIIQMC